MDPPPPYDQRRHAHYHLHSSNSLSNRYLSNRSRERNSSTDLPSQSTSHHFQPRRNSRPPYDRSRDDANSQKNRRNYEKERKKSNDFDNTNKNNSRISVWNRIEEKPSDLASPSESNRSNPPDKELDSVQETTEIPKPDTSGSKKKKVVIRRRIVKKGKKNILDNPTVSSSSLADPGKEVSGSGSGNPNVRRVKRIIIVKKKKGAKTTGEFSVCNEEEIIQQIANQVFSENKSIEGSKVSPEKSVNDIDFPDEKGILVQVDKNLEENNLAGISALKVCTKEEIDEVGSGNYCMDPVHDTPTIVEEKSTLALSPLEQGEVQENDAIIGNIICEEKRLNEEKDEDMKDYDISGNIMGEEKDQDMKDDALISVSSSPKSNDCLYGENLGFDSNLGQNPMQIDSNFEDEETIPENNNNQLEAFSTNVVQLEASSKNGEDFIDKGKSIIIQKSIFQKPIPIPPKFPTSHVINQKPRNKTWRRDDVIIPQNNNNNNLKRQNSYIRKGNSLIRSSSGSNLVPRIPSPNPNPNSVVSDSSNPVNESDSEIEKNSKMVYLKKKSNQIVLNNNNDNNPKSIIPLENPTSNIMSDKVDNKVSRQVKKLESFSNVWTLNSNNNTGTQLKRKTGMINNYYKSFPSLLPWKRTTLLKNSVRKTPILLKSPTSFLIRKLVMARRRDTVYKKSKDGFSICKSRVLSINGSNLIWSRSIDTDSKKANQEATMAVAEAERKKREKRKRHSLHTKGKKGAKSSLDLNKTSSSTGYVRASKGNQLVRNPKSLVRILASEKVQRSLHTLRTRYKRKNKQQYCLFYTRFGRCNKTEGKCNYIHDPKKIAICTKFLRGLCVNSSCQLTHEINPERMPDCSYFLLGLCTNLRCKYRHVKVNPNAPVCDGFLRGYCADGDECRKKHTYTCPQFEQNGECPQGSKCKLYHPKTKSQISKSRKRKPGFQLQSPTGVRARYFESSIDPSEPVINREKNKESSAISSEGQFGDFVILNAEVDGDVTDLDAAYGTDLDAVEEIGLEEEGSDWEMDDELIKPVRVIRDTCLVGF